jgi:hypothetical protein
MLRRPSVGGEEVAIGDEQAERGLHSVMDALGHGADQEVKRARKRGVAAGKRGKRLGLQG